jgi:prepilin-type N-terminal cleavage/methylation domain-containing protein
MEFKPTNLKPRARAAGFTLMEMAIALFIGGILILGVANFYAFSLISFRSIYNYTSLSEMDRNASDFLSRDIRQALSLTNATASQLCFKSPGSNVVYTFDSASRTLTRLQGTDRRTVLKNVTSLNWTLYSRPASNASYNVFPTTTNVSAAKLVSISWVCSTTSGPRTNSEALKTALVSMRNE